MQYNHFNSYLQCIPIGGCVLRHVLQSGKVSRTWTDGSVQLWSNGESFLFTPKGRRGGWGVCQLASLPRDIDIYRHSRHLDKLNGLRREGGHLVSGALTCSDGRKLHEQKKQAATKEQLNGVQCRCRTVDRGETSSARLRESLFLFVSLLLRILRGCVWLNLPGRRPVDFLLVKIVDVRR